MSYRGRCDQWYHLYHKEAVTGLLKANLEPFEPEPKRQERGKWPSLNYIKATEVQTAANEKTKRK